MNHMIHNLTPTPADVYIDYELEFVRDGTPAAAAMQEVRTLWLDVRNGSFYPVFDVHRGAGGRDGRYTFPDESRERNSSRHRMTIQQDGVLVGTGGHLHPGGLWTDLRLERGGRTVRLFRSRAKYFEPAGAVSWDVAMEVTPADWRVGVKAGDVLSVSATYDAKRASWYEAMGIMQVAFNPGGSGPDPFAVDVDVRGRVTHGHLNENRNHGGAFSGLADPRKLLAGPVPRRRTVAINDFLYGAGDLLRTGVRRRPPAIRRGRSLKFVNRDGGHPAHDHLLQGALQPHDGHRLPARQRAGAVRLRQPRLRPAGPDGGGAARDLADAEAPARGDVHVLLPRASVHARRLPRPRR